MPAFTGGVGGGWQVNNPRCLEGPQEDQRNRPEGVELPHLQDTLH